MKKIFLIVISLFFTAVAFGQDSTAVTGKYVHIINSYSYDNEFGHYLEKDLRKNLKELIPSAAIFTSYTDIAYAQNFNDAARELLEALSQTNDIPRIIVFIGDEAWMTYRSLGIRNSSKIVICSTNDIICSDYKTYFETSQISEQNSIKIDSSIIGYNAYVVKYQNTLEQTTKLIKELLPEIDKYIYISKKTFSDKMSIKKLENLVGVNNLNIVELGKDNLNFMKEASPLYNNLKSVILANNYNIWSINDKNYNIPVFFIKQTFTKNISAGGVYEDINEYSNKVASTTAALFNGMPPDYFLVGKADIKTYINGNIAEKLKINIPAELVKYVVKQDSDPLINIVMNIIIIAIAVILIALAVMFTIRWRVKSKRTQLKIIKYSKLFNYYNTIFNNSPAAFAVFDENNDLIESNREYDKLIKPLLKVAKPIKRLKLTELPISDEQTLIKIENGEIIDTLLSFNTIDSSVINYRILIQPMENGKLLMIWDNTQVYNTKKMQQEFDETFKTAINAAKITVAEIDIEKNTIFAGEHWFRNLNINKCNFPECFSKTREEDRYFLDSAILKIKNGYKDIISKNIGVEDYDTVHWYNIAFKAKEGTKGTKVLCILYDINYIVEKELELKKDSDKFIKLKELKNSFILNMSHEIKTPLNAIVGFSELIIESKEKTEKEELLKYIQENNDKLLHLISDIVDMLNIETGEVTCSFSEINLKDLLKDIYNEWQHHTKPGVDFRLIAQDNCIIYSDTEKLKQAIVNLVDNSLQYTNKGFVELGFTSDEKTVSIIIKDSGCGISPEKQEKLFERFNKLTKDHMGIGLGLPIVNSIVKLLNGKIKCDSKINEGTKITIIIPKGLGNIDSQTGIKERLEKGFSQQSATNQKTILIVEDNENNYQLLNFMLKRTYNILHATDGQEAVDMFKANNPDIILMDIKMPIKDGYQATSEIREISKEIPIIAVTAYAFDSDREKVMANAFTGYVTKPVDEKALMDIITKSLNNK